MLEIRVEENREVKRLLEVAVKSEKPDLEAWETALRVAERIGQEMDI